MHELNAAQMLGTLALMLATAKVLGKLAQSIGQPSVLGELVAGVVLGTSCLGVVDAHQPTLHFLGEVGVVILLFEIGLETDLKKLLGVGGAAAAVAVVGVVLPFALGYAVSLSWGFSSMVSILVGASLTATSVGITARVLSDLGQLQRPESQIILGAAVLDDVIGLVILTVVARIAAGAEVTLSGVGAITAIAFGFLLVTLTFGTFVFAPLMRMVRHWDLPGTAPIAALVISFGLAWLAETSGSAMIIGAFAAGLLLRRTPDAEVIEHGVAHIGHFFVPLFFVVVGAAVDLQSLNPLNSESRTTFLLGSSLVLVAMVSKFVAGYAPIWFPGRKSLIGVGMIPRGEVGLIYAQLGLSTQLFDKGIFSAVAMMVMATTLAAPPLLKWLCPRETRGVPKTSREGIEELVN